MKITTGAEKSGKKYKTFMYINDKRYECPVGVSLTESHELCEWFRSVMQVGLLELMRSQQKSKESMSVIKSPNQPSAAQKDEK